MKVLLDMNLSPRWVDFLAVHEIEAVHWSTVGSAKAPDTEIMAFARDHSFVVVTHDLDFSAILAATNVAKPSVVQIRTDDPAPELVGAQVVMAIKQMQLELEQGCLLTVDPKRLRVRILPLRSRHPQTLLAPNT